MIKAIGLFLLSVLLILGLAWVFQGNDFFMYRWFAPRYEQTRREVFEQSKAYRQGLVQELQNMQFEYVKASPEHQAALADIILRRSVDVPEGALPTDLERFIGELRRSRAGGLSEPSGAY